ncbi:MAG: glycosyltransferase [Gemmataceae bacterium]
MKILIIHNYYQQAGGEDRVVEDEVAVLVANGHEVIRYHVHNDAVNGMSRLRVAARTIWSRTSRRELRELIRKHRPHIAHFHNTFPLISPGAYSAVRAEGVPVVQTLHNFRLLCPNALFFRDGKVCEDCLGRTVAWPSVVHACYRGSRSATAATATMLAAHSAMGTWRSSVDTYIALTQFSRSKLVQGGLPADKIVVKPNFVSSDPGPGTGAGNYGIYVGRLSPEKGLPTLLKAWETLGTAPLKIVGDGPLAPIVKEATARLSNVEWLGSQPSEKVYSLIGDAAFVVLPSECYENFPKVAVEAMAKGTPVIASRLGAMAEVVDHGRTGLHFTPGDRADLATQVRRLANATPLRDEMRQAAREEFESKYTAAANYRQLLDIYDRVMATPSTRTNPSRTTPMELTEATK